MRRLPLLVVLVLVAIVGLRAQEQPALSEIERLKFEVINLQAQLARALAERSDCFATLGPLQAHANSQAIDRQLQALKADVETQHPGYEFNVQTGQLTKKPEPPPAAKDR
jgi:hypothetical protein